MGTSLSTLFAPFRLDGCAGTGLPWVVDQQIQHLAHLVASKDVQSGLCVIPPPSLPPSVYTLHLARACMCMHARPGEVLMIRRRGGVVERGKKCHIADLLFYYVL